MIAPDSRVIMDIAALKNDMRLSTANMNNEFVEPSAGLANLIKHNLIYLGVRW